MVQPLVMVVRASSGGQFARTICTLAGKMKTNLHFYLIILLSSNNRRLKQATSPGIASV
jgi:hypothetical protein